jgi:hypothetical protein
MGKEPRNNGKNTGYRKPPVETQFKPGNPGRPKGSRNKLGEDFISALYVDFNEHGPAVIARVRDEKPEAYIKVIASILPKEVKLTASVEEFTDEQLDQKIRQLASILNLDIRTSEEGAAGSVGGTEASRRPH